MPRSFPTGNPGYGNAALATTGVAVAFPPGSQGAYVNVSAGCYFGIRNGATLSTFSDANYGSILNGAVYRITKSDPSTMTHLHLAPWASTAAVAVIFF